jgi:hypothetical protein
MVFTSPFFIFWRLTQQSVGEEPQRDPAVMIRKPSERHTTILYHAFDYL